MGIAPSAILFVNNDLTDNVQAMLVAQLHIDEVISGAEFDTRISEDSDYPQQIKSFGLRIMVVRSLFELQNRDLADLVLFIKNGIAQAIQNKFINCPIEMHPIRQHEHWPHHHRHGNRHHFERPGNTFQVVDIHWGQFGAF